MTNVSTQQEVSKQSYQQPDVTEYGSVTALTQEFSAMGLIVTASVTATILGISLP